MISDWLAPRLARQQHPLRLGDGRRHFLRRWSAPASPARPACSSCPLQKEFGWSTAEISSALSIRFFLFGLMAPFAAALMNRYGLRNVTFTALVCRRRSWSSRWA